MAILISTKGKNNLFYSQAIRTVSVASQTSTLLFTMVFTVISLFTQLQVGHAAEIPKGPAQAGTDWTSWGGGEKGTRYSELDQVNTGNAHRLELEATIPLHAKGNYTGEALIVDGLIYLLEPNADSLYAYRQSTGKVEWSLKAKSLTINDINVSAVNAAELSALGLAYDDGVIYWNHLIGNLLAINTRTGDMIWQQRNILEKGFIGGTPPIIAENKIIIGVSDIETTGSAARGYISAYCGMLFLQLRP